MSDHPVPAPARELTPEERQERVERCFAMEQLIKAALVKGREAVWELACALHAFDEESGWSALGYESLTHWLADPDVGMRKSFYYSLVARYRETIVRRKLPMDTVKQLDPSKVDVVLPAVKSGRVRIEDALDDARQLGHRDLREKYRDQSKPSADDSLLMEGAASVDSVRTENNPEAELVVLPAEQLRQLRRLRDRARRLLRGSVGPVTSALTSRLWKLHSQRRWMRAASERVDRTFSLASLSLWLRSFARRPAGQRHLPGQHPPRARPPCPRRGGPTLRPGEVRCNACRRSQRPLRGGEGSRVRPKPTAPVPRVALTIEEAAAAIGCSPSHFKRHVQPELRIVRSGSTRLVPVAELEQWTDRAATLAGGTDGA